jgi:23S rRNA pseudouridine1911/1915/1917 synthase
MLPIIPPALHDQRLDKALARLVPALSRARLQALMAEGHVTLKGKKITDASRKAKAGEVYDIQIPPPLPAEPEAQKIPLEIVYEDDDVLVIDKPPGLVVHPAPGNRDRTLVNALLAHCGASLSGIGGVARPGIVHRLDKDTSGLMIVAKNDRAHQALSRQFADRTLSRTYQAIVWGVPMPRAGSVEAPIGRHLRDRKKMAVTAKGRTALTHYKLLEAFTKTSLVECKLATGRTHQIRVHLAHIKHPVVGDPVYGRSKGSGGNIVFSRQALHAAALQFCHPRTEKIMRFTADLPKDMADLLKSLKDQK